MPATATESQLDAVKQWLLAKKPELTEIDLDLDLIENRIIDSLGFLDFVYYLEELTNQELQSSLESVSSFRTLRVIRNEILKGA